MTDYEKKLVTIGSGKGGVGKTWLSVSLAHALARAGQRVLIFDGDLGLANVDIQLGITPERDLGAVIAGDAGLTDVITRVETDDKSIIDVIPGRSGSGALGALSPKALQGLRQDLIACGADYDHILLDLAAGVDASVTTLSEHSGKILVVLTGDPTSLTDAYAFIKLTVMRNPGTDIRIVVNNVPNRRDGEKVYQSLKKACEGFLKISPPLVGIVCHDDKVSAAIRMQAPLLARYPQSAAGRDVTALADALMSA